MVVVPLSMSGSDSEKLSTGQPAKPIHWVRIAAAGSLALSGVLLMGGKQRAGLIAAASGTALAMIDQQDVMRDWWDALPIYLDEIQALLGRVQGAVEDVSVQREKLRQVWSAGGRGGPSARG